MPIDPDRYHRRSVRLQGFDYAQTGAYFVTIVTQNRAPFFGEIIEGEMRLNDAGLVIECWWQDLGRRFPSVLTDAFMVMPNHIHGITLVGGRAERNDQGDHIGSPLQLDPSLASIVGWFKTMTTNDYILGVKQDGWSPFDGRLWQRNYYEHIIRNERALDNIRAYIASNPARWQDDDENPARVKW